MRGLRVTAVFVFLGMASYGYADTASQGLRHDNYTGDFRDLKRCGEFLTNAAAAAAEDPENPYIDLDAVRREINDVYARLPDMSQDALNDPLKCCAQIASTKDLSPATRQHLYRQAALTAQEMPKQGWGVLPWIFVPIAACIFYFLKRARAVRRDDSIESEVRE